MWKGGRDNLSIVSYLYSSNTKRRGEGHIKRATLSQQEEPVQSVQQLRYILLSDVYRGATMVHALYARGREVKGGSYFSGLWLLHAFMPGSDKTVRRQRQGKDPFIREGSRP